MQISHTIVALSLPSRAMLRIVTTLSDAPHLLVQPRIYGKTEAVGENRVAIIQEGNLTQCRGGREQYEDTDIIRF